MTTPLAAEAGLGAAEFREVGRIAYEVAGILLPPGKEGLVRSRLAKRLRARSLTSYAEYLAVVRDHASGELAEMVDVLTTNKTNWFREPAHFDFLRDRVLPTLGDAPLRVWSAGCSTGEEPYTLAMVLREALPGLARRDARILATDLSHRVLARARAATYGAQAADEVPADLLRRYFTRSGDGPAAQWTASDALRSLVSFARLNLMGEWPMRGPFQAIFCRNVMIYFDRPTQERLVRRYYDLLAPGGYLFVGHSESLNALRHAFRYVQPAVYQK